MPTVQIFGKKNCGKCEKAKETIGQRLGLEYEYMDISETLKGEVPENWREGDYCDALAAWCHLASLPMVRVNDEMISSYPAAVKRIKQILKEQKIAA